MVPHVGATSIYRTSLIAAQQQQDSTAYRVLAVIVIGKEELASNEVSKVDCVRGWKGGARDMITHLLRKRMEEKLRSPRSCLDCSTEHRLT